MNNLLELKKIDKFYTDGEGQTLEVLKGLNLNVETNSNIVVVGKSGSGKSTLLHLIGGLDIPTRGEILFEGININKFSANDLAHWRNTEVGFIFQMYHLLPDFSVLENVIMPGIILKKKKRKLIEYAKDLLREVELDSKINVKITQLSGGERQRVAIARALINKPRLILADEPTGNLDIQTSDRIFDLLQQIYSQKPTTRIIVTHSVDLAKKGGKCWAIKGGKIDFVT